MNVLVKAVQVWHNSRRDFRFCLHSLLSTEFVFMTPRYQSCHVFLVHVLYSLHRLSSISCPGVIISTGKVTCQQLRDRCRDRCLEAVGIIFTKTAHTFTCIDIISPPNCCITCFSKWCPVMRFQQQGQLQGHKLGSELCKQYVSGVVMGEGSWKTINAGFLSQKKRISSVQYLKQL